MTAMWMLLVMLTCGNSVESTKPGLKVRLSQPGLNYAASVAVNILSAKIEGASLPPQSGTAGIYVGKVHYEVKNMKVTSFTGPSTAVTVNPGHGVTWSLSGAGVSVHGDWSYEYKLWFIKFGDHGTFDADASGISISVSVTLGATSTGEPTIRSTGCSSHIKDFRIRLHGGASWLYNLFIGYVESPVRRDLEKVMCSAARKAIDTDAAKELSTLPVKVPIGKDKQWVLDYRLVASPAFSAGYLESFHKAEFFYHRDPSEAPFKPSPLPSPASTTRMATFWVSDYVLNTAGFVLQKHGFLRYNLTKKDLPPKERGLLNTTCKPFACIGGIVPEIGKRFPHASVEIQMHSTGSPTAEIVPLNVTGSMEGVAVLRARLSNGSLAPLFSMKVTAKLTLTPRLVGNVLKADINAMHETITVFDSHVGPVSAAVLELVFDVAKRTVILPKLKAAGEKGFPLPRVKHVAFVDSGIHLENHCIRVSTDVKYSPSTTLYFQP